MRPSLPAKAALLSGTLLLSAAGSARADTKGAVLAIAGSAALGAELTVVTEALFGLQGNWIYAASSAAGAAASGTAAYYWVNSDSTYAPQFIVAGAFALFIPAMIGLASSQYYRPEVDLHRGVISDLGLNLLMPTFHVGESYTMDQIHHHGLQRSSDFTVYMLNGVF